MTRKTVGLLGLPFDAYSSFRRGCALAPPKIREELWSDAGNPWCEAGFSIRGIIDDRGDVAPEPERDFGEQIRGAVRALLADNLRPLCLGGDHAVTFPAVAAVAEVAGPVNIVHIDAHPDLYHDFEGEPYSHASPFARIMERGLAKRLIQIGIRTMNDHQREQVARFGVEQIPFDAVKPDLDLELEGPVYMSIDLDGLDPAFAPGVSHPEPGGLSTRAVLDILHGLGGKLVGADVVEYNPTRDVRDLTAVVAAKFVKELAGRLYSDTESEV